jgi:integrase/recombinase XerD
MATLYKRGNVWWGRVQRKGVEHRTSFETRTKAVAEKRLRTWLDDLEAQQWGGKRRHAFRDVAKAFVTEYLVTLKPAAATRYGVSLDWLSQKFEDSFMDDIGREELSEFETWRRGLGVSNPTIRRDLACLSSIFTFCEDKEWTDDGRNPVPAYLRRRAKRGLKEADARKRYLSVDEEARLLAKATPEVHIAICVAIDTGLRSEEMFSLTWPQINFAKGTIRTTDDTKNGKSRTVPMPERTAQFLAQKKLKADQANRTRKVASTFVFTHEDGSRILRQNKGLAGAVRRAEIPHVRWHDLRRTAGCRWLQRDKRSLEEVAKMLGHGAKSVTEKAYAFLDEEEVAESIAAQKPAHRPTEKKKISSKNSKKSV